jgi:hypothetical protein
MASDDLIDLMRFARRSLGLGGAENGWLREATFAEVETILEAVLPVILNDGSYSLNMPAPFGNYGLPYVLKVFPYYDGHYARPNFYWYCLQKGLKDSASAEAERKSKLATQLPR